MTDIAKIVSKLQDLFWFGIPKNKRDYQRAGKPAEFLDKTHVMYVRVDPEQVPLESYVGDETRVPKSLSFTYDNSSQVIIGASYLKTLCDVADENMKLTVQDDYPLMVEFTVGGRKVVAYIAMRIENS